MAIILVAAGAPALSGDFDSEYATPGTESHAASELLADRFPMEASGDTIDVVWQAPRGADAEPLEARIGCLVGEAERLDGVARAEAAQVSSGGDIGMVTLQLDRSADAVPAETLQCAPDLSYTAVTSKGSKEVGEFFAVGGC